MQSAKPDQGGGGEGSSEDPVFASYHFEVVRLFRCGGWAGESGAGSSIECKTDVVNSELSPPGGKQGLPDKRTMLSFKHPHGQVNGGLTFCPGHLNCNFIDDISVIWEPLSQSRNNFSLPEAPALSIQTP